MRFSDLLGTGLASLRQRPFRTLLTVLGVVIGTAAVVVMVSLGIGMTQGYTQSVEENPGLRQVHGVGPIVAAQLLVTAGDNPDRLTSDAAFAALCGVSPVPASSGKTTAMRLNRGGDRQANSALHRIVLVRLSHKHPPTMDYVARRTAEGMPKRSIIRCLKRFVGREIHGHLVHPRPAVQTDDLRARRRAIHQPMRLVAIAVGAHLMDISRLERGTNHDPDLAQRYRDWLSQEELAS